MIVKRQVNPSKKQSFFLFGARGTGKTTFLKSFFEGHRVLRFDLLEPETEDRLLTNPSSFRNEILSRREELDWVVVDEVQKAPRILNLVHKMIVEDKVSFALTGSSARRLKQKGVNLLAGRAFSEVLHPFTHLELLENFDLEKVMHFGSLPECYFFSEDDLRSKYLRSYVLNYVQQEIQSEQWVRNLEPFRKFLTVAGQSSGKILNYSNIARDVGVTGPTVMSYFEILEDTYLGFRIPAHSNSFRKQQRSAPKFFTFDLGVKRALEKSLEGKLAEGTGAYGDAFEHFIIAEIFRLLSYSKPDAALSYLLSKDGAEVDLIISQPGKPEILVEIKSKKRVDERDARHLFRYEHDFKSPLLLLISQDEQAQKIGSVTALPWKEGLRKILSS